MSAVEDQAASMAKSAERQAKFTNRKRKLGEPMRLPATVIGGELGTFYVDFVLWNRGMTDSRKLTALVDTGPSYVQAPAAVLEELGVERERSIQFTQADGSKRELSLGWTSMELGGNFANVYVIFGDEGSSILLGAMALETFALAVDAKNQQLIPADVPL